MKKAKLQIILISILTFGMISLLVCLSLNLNETNDDNYIPTNIEENESLSKSIDLNDYQKINFSKRVFPIFTNLIDGQVYFDPTLSYKEYTIDSLNYNLGDIVKKNSVLGKANNADIILEKNCMVVDIKDDKVTLKILDEVFIKYSFNIYESKNYKINDEFSIFKNGKEVTSGKIISVDYMNIIDDCATAILEVDNSNLFFLSGTSVNFAEKNYEKRESYSTFSSYFNIYDRKYRVLNELKTVLCIKDNKIYSINIKLGICFDQYIEVTEAISDFKPFNFIDGDCYVKSTFN